MEWLRLLPNRGCLPHTLHTLAIGGPSLGGTEGRGAPTASRAEARRRSMPDAARQPAAPVPFAGEADLAGPLPARRPDPGWWDRPLTDLPGVGRVTAERATAMG